MKYWFYILFLTLAETKAQYSYPLERCKSGFDFEIGGSSPIFSIQYKRYYHISTKSFVSVQFGWGKILGDDLYSYPFGLTFQKRLPRRVKNPCNPAPINRKKVWYWHIGTGLTIIPKRYVADNTAYLAFGQFGLGYLTGSANFPYMLKFSATPLYIIGTDTFLPLVGISFSILDKLRRNLTPKQSPQLSRL